MQLLVLLALVRVATVAGGSAAAGNGDQTSPVTRIVELLKGLAQKVEEDQKTESDLFESYQCWARTVIETKTAMNAKAQSRIDSLSQYVKDLEAGRIELTTERVDLEKEIADLRKDIDTADRLRAKEHEDYLAAGSEMTQAVAALSDAITVLKNATESSEDAPGSSFLVTGSRSRGTLSAFRAMMAESDELSRAMDFGRRFLSNTDALFLRRILTGDVPSVDWSKLNRKADFKAKYEARSGEIIDTLMQLNATFAANLEEVEARETKAQEDHDTLMTAKKTLRDQAIEALETEELEGGARGLSVTDAKDEIKALEDQVIADDGFISDTQTSITDKTKEFKERKQVRVDEGKAISKAIEILYNDDARDNFRKSLTSQSGGFLFFLQRGANHGVAHGAAIDRLTLALSHVVKVSGDARILSLITAVKATREGEKEAIDKVITMIDEMISALDAEKTEDENLKSQCETDRTDNTKKAGEASRKIDELVEQIAALESEIEELRVQIKEKKEAIQEFEKALKEATKMREEENKAWVLSDQEDTEAAASVVKATKVLDDFYKQARLLQTHAHTRQPLSDQIVAGEKAPDAPDTWESGGSVSNTDAGNSIIGILELLEADILKDQVDAKTAEDAAQTAYDTFKTETETEIGTLNTDIGDLEGQISTKETDILTKSEEKNTKKDELADYVDNLKKAESGCDFILVHYDVRVANRLIEIKGLEQAKEILSAAELTDA